MVAFVVSLSGPLLNDSLQLNISKGNLCDGLYHWGCYLFNFKPICGRSGSKPYPDYLYGYNSKASFNIGAQYNEKLSFGLNLNSHFGEHNQSTLLLESNSND